MSKLLQRDVTKWGVVHRSVDLRGRDSDSAQALAGAARQRRKRANGDDDTDDYDASPTSNSIDASVDGPTVRRGSFPLTHGGFHQYTSLVVDAIKPGRCAPAAALFHRHGGV